MSGAYDMRRLRRLGTQKYFPQSAIYEEDRENYMGAPGVQESLQTPADAGINIPGFVNPYRTVMYYVQGLSASIPTRVLPGNYKRTYLIVQNQGPGNLFVGIGVDPNAGGLNVLSLVSTQIYEQVGGGTFIPPSPSFPDGLSWAASFVSPEYISLLTDASGATAMVVEGSYSPPRAGQVTPGR